MVVVLGFVRIVPAELWTLALIYRMLFPGGFCSSAPGPPAWANFRVYGYTGCVRSTCMCICICTENSIRPFAGRIADSHSDLLPYFPDPETRSNTATADPPPPQFGDLLFGTHADTWGLNFGCSISIDTSLSRLDSCPGSTFFAAFEK